MLTAVPCDRARPFFYAEEYMLRHLRLIGLAAALLVTSAGHALFGQGAATTTSPGPFDTLHFRSIGPAVMSGRFTDVAVFEKKPSTFYLATAHSGVWKTINDGVTFTAQFQDQGLMSIGDVTMSQSNPDLVWIGTGEANNRQSTSWGDGVFKSVDGGRTWKNMGLRQSFHVNRIAIDPNDNNIVFVAAGGSLFGPGGDRGVYKTSDGGATWKPVLTVDDDTGASELAMDPTNSRILYASTYQRRRSQCCFNGGGPGSGLWKSIDAGETWARLTAGLPTGPLGRIGLDVYRKSPNILYALIEAEGGGGGGRGGGGAAAAPPTPSAPVAQAGSGIYRSDDAGATWTRVGATNPRPMYFSQVRIDPNSPNRLLIANVQVMLSNDGGRTFANADATIHDDTHAIWWDPANSDHILIGTDGGVGASWDGTKTWRFLPNLATGLFYHVGFDMATPFNVCGGMQDNDVWCGPSAVRTQRGIWNEEWARLQIGDGTVTIVDPMDQRIVYSSTQDGSIQRKNKVTGESKTIRPSAQNVVNAHAGDAAYRFNWDTPVGFSPIDHALLVGGQRVFRSTDRGDSWTAISPDLTLNGTRADAVLMGVKDSDIRISANDGIVAWPTIVTLAESPKLAGVYYAGTDDGVVQMTRDAGKSWTNITGRLPGFPPGAWVSEVVPSRFDAGTVYVTVDAHRLNDYQTHVWASNDFGTTFRSINANLAGEVIKTLTEDQRNADVLYVGAETGLFVTIDRGKTWSRLKANFPTVRVDEITLHPRDNAMILATHGRALWVLDHLEPIQEWATFQSSSADAALFSIPRAIEWRTTDDRNMEFWGDGFFLGENPPAEAVVQFALKRAVTEVKLKIADALGKPIREIAFPTRNQPGIQTACWDMRLEPIAAGGGGGGRGGGAGGGGRGGGATIPESGPNAGFSNPCGGGGGGRGGGGAPWVLPGTYNVSLVIDGKVADTKSMVVALDPAHQMPEGQMKRYDDMVTDLHEMQGRGEAAASAMLPFHTQMADINARIGGMANVPADVKTQFAALMKDYDAMRVKFGVPPAAAGGGRGGGGGGRGGAVDPQNLVARAGALKTQLMAFWEMPGDALVRQYADLKLSFPKAVSEANAVYAKANALSAMLKKYELMLTVPAQIK
jgi:photosystem II stability/assembly factor-like uncharacterized protein